LKSVVKEIISSTKALKDTSDKISGIDNLD